MTLRMALPYMQYSYPEITSTFDGFASFARIQKTHASYYSWLTFDRLRDCLSFDVNARHRGDDAALNVAFERFQRTGEVWWPA